MILDSSNQVTEAVQDLYGYADLYEVLYSLQNLDNHQDSEYTDTMISELSKALENREDVSIVDEVLSTLRQAQIL